MESNPSDCINNMVMVEKGDRLKVKKNKTKSVVVIFDKNDEGPKWTENNNDNNDENELSLRSRQTEQTGSISILSLS